MHDQMASGRRLRVLNIVDDLTRESLQAVPDTSTSGRRAMRELAELIVERGKPGMIVSDKPVLSACFGRQPEGAPN